MVNIHPKEGRSRRHKYPVRSLDLHTQPSHYEPLFRHGKLSSPTTPSTILVEFVVRCKLKDNNPLMILTQLTSKLYHLLLNTSKRLQGIRLSKFNDLQDYASFSLYPYHMQHFRNQPNTNQFISSTLQIDINEARKYFLQKKANSSEKRYMKTRAKS